MINNQIEFEIDENFTSTHKEGCDFCDCNSCKDARKHPMKEENK